MVFCTMMLMLPPLLLLTPLVWAEDGALERQALDILKKRCAACHGGPTPASKLSLTTREGVLKGGARSGPAVIAGKPEESPLILFLNGVEKPRMPMGQDDPMAAEELAALRRWIAEMAPVAKAEKSAWWAFVKPRKPELPAVKNPAWGRNEIDRFVLARLESKGLTGAVEAPRAMLARRLYFDLLGVPPRLEDVTSFAADTASGAYEQLVDRLLADRRFGERWGRHWLDLARYADTQGFEADRENYHMWRYRDYVIRAFQQDKPYNVFLREQLAGDEIPNGGEDAMVATGFLRLGPRFQSTMAQQLRQMTLDEITGTVASVFLGMTVKCAQCHDHKYDPIPQKDYYRLQAFFGPLEFLESRVGFPDGNQRQAMLDGGAAARARIEKAQAEFDAYQKWMTAKLEAAGVKIPERVGNAAVALAADEITTESFQRKLTPAVAELERRITRAIANGVVVNPDDKIFSTEEKEKYIRLLSFVDGNRGGRDMGVYQRELRRYEPVAHVVRNIPNDPNRPFLPVTFVRIKGEFDQPGEWVKPGYLSAATGNGADAELTTDQFGNVRAYRTALAQWMGSAENPLTSRVMVNRIWQHLFGSGIVATPSDFGRNGAAPTHPELLDYLAVRFVERQWSVKALVRMIVLSAAYRQTSVRTAAREEREDASNTLLWRQNRRRLEGDILRDHLLAVGGTLRAEGGGPGVFVPLPAAMKERMTIKNMPSWTPAEGPEIYRRSVYVFQRRQLEVPFLSTFDTPVFQFSCERRVASTTALQALTLLNDGMVVEQARRLAATIGDRRMSPKERVAEAFRLVLLREPEPREWARAADLAASTRDGLESLCRALLNTNEFLYVD